MVHQKIGRPKWLSMKPVHSLGAIEVYIRQFCIQLRVRLHNFTENWPLKLSTGHICSWRADLSLCPFSVTWKLSRYSSLGWFLAGIYFRIGWFMVIVPFWPTNHQPWQPGLTVCWWSCLKIYIGLFCPYLKHVTYYFFNSYYDLVH